MTAGETGLRPDTGDDSITWQRPSPQLLRARRIQVAVVAVVVAAIGGLIGSSFVKSPQQIAADTAAPPPTVPPSTAPSSIVEVPRVQAA